jgi:Kef-type K+ transport system membrane component KefB
MLLINLSRKNLRILTALQPLTPPLYAIFFAIAGTELKLSIFANPSFFFIGMSFILLRACGKYFGVYFGSRALKLEPKIRNYLGLSLLPQAGVAIGLVLFIQGSPLVRDASPHVLTEIREMINIVLMSVFVNEIAGPPLATIAIKKNLKRRI